ncbi:PREDICTED: protein FAM183A-like [Papilio xuthus]|uniref:Protein FAM183A n=1 Tax=Papilio xuthus TaxID=66420 RepID=A0A194Q5M0_PAPXU|nr:PREDICTED: protein FAM183A-like [Papilio xuthus]XP_013177936.1 PREDICTED: protein FAM183A-like [Papilio xuthus]KPJ00843.1 Protein FAM183A [Papilio xuthus]
MDPGKCTFGIRMPININMLNQIIYRELKHFRNYKIYRPNFKATPVTSKFYAAHDQIGEVSRELADKENNYCINVAKYRAKGPRSNYPWPVTDNQTYGWFSEPLLKIDRNDRRLYYPLRESSHTKTEMQIQMANPRKHLK